MVMYVIMKIENNYLYFMIINGISYSIMTGKSTIKMSVSILKECFSTFF